MTAKAIAKEVEKIIKNAAGDDAAFEARLLVCTLLKISRTAFFADIATVKDDDCKKILAAAARRAEGYPLQYILGEWEFFSLPFIVGEGVLVPRADTEILVECALEFLKNHEKAQVADLCAGSGCVGIAVAKNSTDAEVTAYEKSDAAFAFLEKNIALNGAAVTAKKADILIPPEKSFDLILSNPPYIESAVIPTLEKEVLCEPEMALDGGADGLLFYRTIAEKWRKNLKIGGAIMVEIGYNQRCAVCDIFNAAGLCGVRCVKDNGGNDRVVIGYR